MQVSKCAVFLVAVVEHFDQMISYQGYVSLGQFTFLTGHELVEIAVPLKI